MNKILSTLEKRDLLKQGEITCEENAKDFLARIEKNNENLGIFLETFDFVTEKAKKLDEKRKSGENLGKLFGLVVAIKSNISYGGASISCASETLENYKGSFSADVVNALEEEDALIIGVVNNDEFACGSSGETSFFGKTLNPACPSRIPGGSSSGSAASVAANLCDIALGSDTGGSIRNPASHCGVVGIKPTYGRVSRYGLIDLSMSLDQIGPISRDVEGSALALECISGKSKNDSTTSHNLVENYSEYLNNSKKYKVGIISQFDDFIKEKKIKKTYSELQDKLKQEGHEIIELNLKGVDLGIQAYYPIVYTEFFSGTRKFDGVKYGFKIEDKVGPEVLRRILGGKEISKSEYEGAYYKKALQVKKIIESEFSRAFEKVDIILAPTTPSLPHKFSQTLTPEEMYAYDAFTIPANLGGICAGVVPVRKVKIEDEEVPIGFQIFAKGFDEVSMVSGMNLLDSLSKK